jgi:hypothetical protein
MGRKSRTIFAVLIAVIIVVAMFSAFGLTLFRNQTSSIVISTLSDTNTSDQISTETSSANSSFVKVDVTPETVQEIIKTLSRPASFYRTVALTTTSSIGSSTVTAKVWVDGGWTKIELSLPNHLTQKTIVGENKLYLWYNHDTTYRTFLADTENNEDSDTAQRIPTYEDISTLDQSDITDARYETKDDYTCIYVEATDTTTGYVEHYWVSVNNGLLIAYEKWSDGILIFQMSPIGNIDTPTGSDADFSLPDGKNLHPLQG